MCSLRLGSRGDIEMDAHHPDHAAFSSHRPAPTKQSNDTNHLDVGDDDQGGTGSRISPEIVSPWPGHANGHRDEFDAPRPPLSARCLTLYSLTVPSIPGSTCRLGLQLPFPRPHVRPSAAGSKRCRLSRNAASTCCCSTNCWLSRLLAFIKLCVCPPLVSPSCYWRHAMPLRHRDVETREPLRPHQPHPEHSIEQRRPHSTPAGAR